MSVSLYRWTEACDGQPCVGDCDKCGDLISRQDAIEALCKVCNMTTDYHKCTGYAEDSIWCEEITALRNVPSAHCTDCPLKGVVAKLP